MPPKLQVLLGDVAENFLGPQVRRNRDVHVDLRQGLVPFVHRAPLVAEDMLRAGGKALCHVAAYAAQATT